MRFQDICNLFRSLYLKQKAHNICQEWLLKDSEAFKTQWIVINYRPLNYKLPL